MPAHRSVSSQAHGRVTRAQEDQVYLAEERDKPDCKAEGDEGLADSSVDASGHSACTALAGRLPGVLRPTTASCRGVSPPLVLRRKAFSTRTVEAFCQV